ncbi:putative flavin-binding monooxygenase [Polychaeton citri CBS 116435]|uniref:Flavin-binding monooxygenase n=1 Tax=Polychaeton citri CBS 116435 TaxID=1314669 RepID=A0A9P4Q3C0_9PEZI|nr:putative flavin-binding monooxygenase [Polychaeton citri CBS 116435]
MTAVSQHESSGKASLDATVDHATNDEDTDQWVYPYPTNFQISEHPIDKARELKVAVIGAGLAGVLAAILLPIKVPGIRLTIIEKNHEVGGTWLENIYPGVRCDIPAHVYQSTFDPNTQWSEVFAQGTEIREYWQKLAHKYDVYGNTTFNSKVLGLYWEDSIASWRLPVQDTKTGVQRTEHYNFVIPAVSHFNEWKLPEYPGIESYKGHLRHSSNWDPTFDPCGKRIAVIGNGASGVQIVPNLQKVASHLDHYARSGTWIAGSFGGNIQRTLEPIYYDAEQLQSFKDSKKYHQYRKGLESAFWRRYETQLKDTPATRETTKQFTELMRQRVNGKPEILEQILPTFSPHCRRLTPGPGYLEALTKENVSFIRTPIEKFTEHGILTVDGVHRAVDAVICSTGANVDFAPPFPIVADRIDLSQAWRPEGLYGFPYTYIGLATPGFPNLMFLHGPNGAGASGTVPHSIETQVAYMAKVLRKVAFQGIRTIAPLKAAADDFVEYCDAFFPRTVLSQNCSSWANGRRPGGRIHGLWPGSAAHVTWVRREPRWEDWEYTQVKPGNRFAWFGNGQTSRESDPTSDVTPYLMEPDNIDLRDYHERWWDL